MRAGEGRVPTDGSMPTDGSGPADEHTPVEIFFDPSGRRWRRVKRWVFGLVVFAAVGILVSWGPIRSPPAVAVHGRPPPPVALEGLGATPVVGTGPLLRLVEVDERSGEPLALDPLSGATVGTLTRDQVKAAGNNRYVLYRYGYDEGVRKTIALTFDDGPDPVWTPRVLDVLAHHGVPATFFVVGAGVVRHPELVNRAVREGHTVANHTMNHPQPTVSTLGPEIVTADRVITATTNVRTDLFRLPYAGDAPTGTVGEGALVLEAQRLGYQVSLQDFDPSDWKYGEASDRPAAPMPLPPRSMENITVLLHDGGGDRSHTIAYLEQLIPWARQHGYTFHSLPQVSEAARAGTTTQAPSIWDREALLLYQFRWLVPDALLRMLFWFAVGSVVIGGLLNVLLAVGRAARGRRRDYGLVDDRGPPVTAVVTAYNEATVIGECLTAVCRSRYPRLIEIIVVDDGSTDMTGEIVSAMAAWDPRIRLIRQPNRGKASALNRAFVEARGRVVVTLDADTLLTPETVGRLVAPFARDADGRLGAVAGTVKVGNLGNPLTRWQALEYIMQIGVDRGAQDALRAIVVVPGACAAWRRQAVLWAGGYSTETLAEDCDLALQLQHLGYRVVQSDWAESFTEVPETFRQLSRQRFRWTYGNAQALWKHRAMVLNPRYGWLGMFSLPAAVLSIIMPLIFLPFVYGMLVVTISQGRGDLLLAYGAIFLAVQVIQAIAGVVLIRERPVHLAILPVYRLIAEPLRAYLLYKSALTVLRGTRSRWHKVSRTGAATVPEPALARPGP